MLKGGAFFFALLFVIAPAFAQDQMADFWQSQNSQLLNLSEAAPYEGSPLVYVEGIRPPEKANNDLEELQLKLFGTKNVREATKNTLKLSDITLETQDQQPELVFLNPLHQETRSAFIPHISNFMAIIQILNRDQLIVNENVTLINTKENNSWTRHIALQPLSSAKFVSFMQNGQVQSVTTEEQIGDVTFTSAIPLDIGVNHIVFKYTVQKPFIGNEFNFNLIGSDSPWPIEQFKTLVLFPAAMQLTGTKLLFGNNQMDIPDIYSQKTDSRSNTNFTINRVVPPRAKIQLHMQFDVNTLPKPDQLNTHLWILWGTGILLILYWILFGWWERRTIRKGRLPKIKYPHSLLSLAQQLSTIMTPQKWQQLIRFGEKNNWPLQKLNAEKDAFEKTPRKAVIEAALSNFIMLIFEPFVGTTLLVIGAALTLYYVQESYPLRGLLILVIFAVLGLYLLYALSLKQTRRLYWQRKLAQLSNKTILTGLTSMQVRQIYPLFILTQKNEEWRKNLIKTNPKIAQETHLYKEEK